MPEQHTEGRPGFQGSETSWMEATFYRHGDDPIVVTNPFEMPLTGRGGHRDPRDIWPSLISASTNKAIGAPSGNFVLQMKASRGVQTLFEDLVDDDWVDIVIYRHDQPWHTMRGLVDEIRRSKATTGTGATVEVFTVTGRDFGKVWELSPVWFSPYGNDLVSKAVANKVFQARPRILGSPDTVVKAFLRDFLEQITTAVGPNWSPPAGMPNMDPGSFIDNVQFNVENFQNIPPRKAFNPQHMAPTGTLWSLAQQYTDPMFCEMWVDLLPDADPLSPRIAAGDSLSPKDTRMTVVLRDRPFPVVDPEVTAFSFAAGTYQDNWKNVPVLTIPRQQILTSDLGRSGLERFNAYFVAEVLLQDVAKEGAVNIIAPLYDKEGIKRHGFRRMDVQSRQVPDEKALAFKTMADTQRRLIRDWYCLNPYLLNGSVELAVGRPDIKVGTRVRVPATVGEGSEESYYVEQIGHSWTFGSSVKTSLGVVRGWQGDDDSYRDALKEMSKRYKLPVLKKDLNVE